MIKELQGDILHTGAKTIAHGVAPNDEFKTGLSLSLRQSWPAMYKDFRHYCQTNHPKPGTIWVWAGADGVRIASLFTQDGTISHHGGKPGPASLVNVAHCLKALQKDAEVEHYASLALPRLATGVGGLAWDDVRPLMEKYLQPLNIPVYVYSTYRPDVKAIED